MKHFWAIVALLVVLVSVPWLQAAEKQYGPGRIVDVEKKARERVLYYLVNTPVTQDDPYYELSVQQGTWLYLAEYTPRHAADSLSDEWKPGAEVQMKVTDKHHAWVKLSGLPELQVIVVKRIPATRDMAAPNAVPVRKSSAFRCKRSVPGRRQHRRLLWSQVIPAFPRYVTPRAR